MPVPKGKQVWGQGGRLSLCGVLPWWLPNLAVFLPAFPSGKAPERLKKIWAPARSLVKKQTVFTFSKSNIPA